MVPLGEVPDPANPPEGCGFHTRCPEAMDVCREVSPGWRALDDSGWRVRCHLYDARPVPVSLHGRAGGARADELPGAPGGASANTAAQT
jgi:hypothetical protein